MNILFSARPPGRALRLGLLAGCLFAGTAGAALPLNWSTTVDTGAAVPDRTRAVALLTNGDVIAATQIGVGANAQVRVQRLAAADGVAAWTLDLGTAGQADEVTAIVANPATGDSYAALRVSTMANGLDWSIVKINANGTAGWTAPLSTLGNDIPRAITLAPDGHVVVAGMTTVSNSSRARVAKLDSATGGDIWSITESSASDAFDVITDVTGQIYLCGSSGSSTLLKSLTSGGSVSWTKASGGLGGALTSLTLFANGDIGAAGFIGGFNQGANFHAVRQPVIGLAATWTLTLDGGAAGDDAAYDIVADSAGNAYVAGMLNTVSGQTGTLRKLSPTGTETWSRTMNGTSASSQAVDSFFAVRLVDGGVVAAGTQSNTVTAADLIISHYDDAGTLIGDTVYNGAANNLDTSLSPNLVAVNATRLVIAGDTENATPSPDGIVRSYAAPAAPSPAEIAVEQPAGTDLTDGSPTPIAFGTVDVAASAVKTFTVKNTGTGVLTLGVVTFTGANGADFKASAYGVNPVPALGSTTFNVTFSPLGAGNRVAAMQIPSDDTDENPFDVNLSGAGAAVIGGTWTGGTPVIDTTGPFDATGVTFDTDLGFVPTPGQTYVFVEADGGITGTFNDLPDDGVVAMAINGVIYYFRVDYTATQITLTNFTPSGPAAWKWIAGPNARNGIGVYGTLNTPDPGNNPGARQGAMNWRAPDGSLWMFGGYGQWSVSSATPRYLNDVWQYRRDIGRWVWRAGSNMSNQVGVYGVQGTEAAGNSPGSRHSGTTWIDASGNLWVFGGYGVGSTAVGAAPLNDLWRYNRGTGQWTWFKGSVLINGTATYGVQGTGAAANTPGARSNATGFFRNGSLWLFGGYSGTNRYNDLWRYDIATGNWTWVGGSNTANQNGVYGVQGTPAAGNIPGSRNDATGWVALDGTLWMFGGLGLPAAGVTAGDLSDLWKYDPVSGQWAWIKGVNTLNAAGVYGSMNVPAPGNLPGARSAGSGWATVDGDLWLIAGFKNAGQSFDDVWIYDIGTNQWTWLLGSAGLLNQSGVYGTQGVAAAGNKPGGRFTPSTWVTLNGSLWIFGGGGADAFGNTGRLSDLWHYGIPKPAFAPYEDPIPDAFPNELIVNADPSASDATAGTMAYVPVSGQLTGSDADGDRLLFGSAGATTNSQGTLTLNQDGTWTFTPAFGFTGVASFQFKAADNYGGQSAVKSLVISVSAHPADSDGDGIADSYEQSIWGSLAAADGDGDADLDGQSNYFEFLAGTNPLNANESLNTAPTVTGTTSANGSVQLQLNSVRPGVNYHLETSTDLDVWSRIGTFTFSTAGSATVEDPSPSTGAPKFYRMSLEATSAVIVP